jgi:hypothetical protein
MMKRRYTKCLGAVAAAWLGWCLVAGAEESLLKNGSFETPLDPDNWPCDMAASWIRWGSWMNREAFWAPTKDGECMMGFHHFRLRGPDNAGFYQDVKDAKAGGKYNFRIFAWQDKGSNVEEVELQFHSFHGGSMVTSRLFRASSIKEDQWTELGMSATIPSDGLRVMVVVQPKVSGLRKGAMKFDAATLVKEE